MTSKIGQLVPAEAPVDAAGEFTSTPSSDGPVLGQWYWVKASKKREPDWLGCATKIGSNFIRIDSPLSGQGYKSDRVLFKDFHSTLRHEPDASRILREKVSFYQGESAMLIAKVSELTMRLGLTPAAALQGAPKQSGTELAVLSGQVDVKAYGTALQLAKDVQLPELFKAIEVANDNLAGWMKAPTLPLSATVDVMKDSIKHIDSRIFNISLYAGLAEQCITCCEGEPAAITEKLHVMQRMAFMDEECLLTYEAGGLEFKDIEAFDRWLCIPENRNRLLPFPRTLLAMRVRRTRKERDSHGSISQAYVNMGRAIQDRSTFLYVRNGDQVSCLECDMDFGEMIFPDKSIYDPLEPKMVKMYGDRVESFLAITAFEQLKAEQEALAAELVEWRKLNPDAGWMQEPMRFRRYDFHAAHWLPVDQSNVYFDECMEHINKQIAEFNRVALIIQGLFDRSLVLHPHLPVQSWHQGGFDQAITLVYDASNVLHYKEALDFEAYRASCNESLGVGSITVGQDDFWQRKEASKEGVRRDNDYRDKSGYRPTHFSPYGNPGPGLVSALAKWSPKNKAATFTWSREKRFNQFAAAEERTAICHLTVPAAQLLNVSAYKSGDFKQFFKDPRTRREYLQWAPLLLAAEDYVSEQNVNKNDRTIKN